MVKKIIIVLLCCTAYSTYAQNGTVSPYSYFGVGELRATNTVENQMMGNLGVYADSIHVNLNNPAAYGKLKLTTYSAGMSRKSLTLKSATEKENVSVTNLDYIAIAMPISSKTGMGFGLMPYSSVGYRLLSESTNDNQDAVTNIFSGEGGLNKVYFSLGHQLFKNFGIGATVNFKFGNLESERIQTVENVQLGTLDRRDSKIQGYDFSLAVNYTPKITDKLTLFSSVVVNTQSNLISKNEQSLGSISPITGQEIEVFDVNLDASNLRNLTLKIPTTTTLGLGIGESKKWFIGAEYSKQELGTYTNEFLKINNVQYQTASSIAFGAFLIPDYTSFNSYLKKVTYRAGFRFENTGMLVDNTEINDFGITFGLGLPLGYRSGAFSNLNLGFEIGKKGTTDGSLVEEGYFKINMGLSLNDKWFRKRTIN